VHDVIFQDRREAGRVLAQAVIDARLPDLKDATVLGLVRGGVPVAYEVAIACGLPLDVMIVRKLGAPGCREYAMGAMASGGAMVVNSDALRNFGVSEKALQHMIDEHTREIERLESLYREGRPPLDFGAGGVILVDDGLATGSSMRAAVRAVRPRATRVTVAVPVAARSTCDELDTEVDNMICPFTPDPLEAVSLFYRDFEPTGDDEVRSLLAEARRLQGTREQGTEGIG